MLVYLYQCFHGENGILAKASLAKSKSEEAQNDENTKLSKYDEYLDNYTTRSGDITVSQDTMNSILSRLDTLENKVNNKARIDLLEETPTLISTTSTTYVPLGTQKTFTSYGNDLHIDAFVSIYKTSGWSWVFGIRIDGIDYDISWGCNTSIQSISGTRIISGINAGTHTIQLLYRSNNSGYAANIPASMAYGFSLFEL